MANTITPMMAKLQALVLQKDTYIDDIRLYSRWKAIKKHMVLQTGWRLTVWRGMLKVEDQMLIAKKSQKFKPLSRLDWANYKPKGLANAIETDTVLAYYDSVLDYNHDWRDTGKEKVLKTHYANRSGRNIDNLDNL
tara:strand:+ start:1069 stop:1476 length:408 start_codon:yes stop_codon:yes gene_type:complete